ncbi:eCIS core domain-containing protein [Streptomyces sp. LE64]|uniref:eCIS core domain-containing protein n=1 Tax=Streptomyces sp. LE64 TaxID=3448653 RepID=UPI004041D41A
MSGVTRVRQQQPEPPRRTRAKRSAPLWDAWARRTPPAPQEVLARAGKPLEPGVGRLMEEWLGHDFSAVRIHSDRDAAVLAETVGADAVAVGRDIFFAAGAYRPETAQGLRLLAHELLHTVQVPDAPGRLRLGRQDGALSRPLDGVEREAEERVNRAADDRAAGGKSAGVGEREARGRGAQPVSWLRFVSVDVSQMRAEQLDPATLVDRIVAGVVRTLHGDPADAAGRVRQQLVRLAPELRSAVLTRLRQRLPSPECLRVERLVAEAETPAGTPVGAATVPEPVVEPAERERTERRDLAEREAGDERGRADRERDGAEEQRQHAQDRERTDEGTAEEAERKQQDIEREKEAALDRKRGEEADEQDERGREDEERRSAAEKGEEAEPEVGEHAAGGRPASAEAPVGGAATPSTAAPSGAGVDGAGPEVIVGAQVATAAPVGSAGTDPVREDRAEAVANDPQGPLAKHGLAKEPDGRNEPPEQEKPLHTEAGAESEVPAPDAAADPEPPQRAVEGAEHAAGADGPAPDPVPKTDPDLSAVPAVDEELTAAQGSAPPKPRELPSLPAPPPVEAEPQDPDRVEKAERAAEPEWERADAQAPEDRAVEAEGERTASDTPPATSAVEATVPPGAPEGPAAADPVPPASVAPAPAEPPATGNPVDPATEPRPTGGEADGVAPAPLGAPAGAGGPATPVPEEPRPAEPMPGDPPLADAAAAPGAGPGAAQSAPGQPGAGGGAPGVGAEGSLETGGGGCAGAPTATTEADAQGGDGGGGCGGGAPAAPAAPAEKEADAPPDVTDREPAAALATISSQPPARIPQALGGVDRAVSSTVGREHRDLQDAPPTLLRPSGAPRTRAGAPSTGAPVSTAVEPMTEVTPQTLAEQRRADPPPTADTPNPATRVKAPLVAGGNEEKAGAEEIQQLQGAVNGVPTSDDRLHTTVGAAPTVTLAGATDPALADEQRRQTEDRIHRTHVLGRQDAAVGLGEDQIHPDVPGETLTASVPDRAPAGGAPATAGGPGAGGTDPDTVSAVAVQERGPQIRAGFADGQGRMGRARQDKQTRSDQAETDNRERVRQTIAENADQQAAVRQEAREDAAGKRGEWRDEQDAAVEDNTTTATEAHGKAREDTSAKKTDTDAEIEKRKNADDERIEGERKAAEEKARKEREAAKEESSGWWGWVKSKVKAAFDALVSAIRGLFDLAVKAINAIKEGFKKAVNGLIDLAARAITGIIKALANALLAVVSVIGTVFPGIAERMRKAIVSLRDAAIARVQRFADRLKKAVNALVDALAGALVAVLRLYEKLLLAAVEVVRGAVTAAIAFVESAIKVLGELAALVKDIAPDPLGWVRNFGTAAKEGVRTFLWGAVKTAVKEWFNAKVESVVGVGKLLWNVLVKGCMSVAQIGRMAWQAIVRSLPAMIVSIVIEKLVGLLVPAVGGIIAIAQGVMAAYQSASRIIAALSAFLTFAKAVKTGGVAAACLFAKAVASGAVALLDFIANFLMARIAGALKGVGVKLKGIAEKIMKGLGRGARGVRKAAGRAVNAARQQLRRGVAAVRRGAVATAGAVRRGLTTGARAVRSGARRVGAAAGSGLRGAARGARRAAGAVGRVVAPALKAVNRTLKRLGGRLSRSGLGRALKASAGKLKGLVAKGRQKFRDWRKAVADRSRQNRRDKKGHGESKDARLARIVERIRPIVRGSLGKGIRSRLLRALLAGLRAWYRITGLAREGSDAFRVRAWLNPSRPVIDGVPADFANRLLHFIHQLGAEIAEEAARRAGSMTDAHGEPVKLGESGIDVQAAMRAQPTKGPRGTNVMSYTTDDGKTIDVHSIQMMGPRTNPHATDPSNQLVGWTVERDGKPIRKYLSYPDFDRLLQRMTPEQRSSIARHAGQAMQGKVTSGLSGTNGVELVQWFVHQEGRRSPATFVTGAMSVDLAARGKRDLLEVAAEHPMRPVGAKKTSERLSSHLGDVEAHRQDTASGRRPRDLTSGRKPDQMRRRELAILRSWLKHTAGLEAWVRTLDNVDFTDKASADAKLEYLKREIRERMFKAWGIDPASRRSD